MNVTGERYFRLMDGEQKISQHTSIEECMERAVKHCLTKGKGTHNLTVIPPTKKIEIEVI